VCKVSNKDRSVTEAMTKDDVDQVSQYIAIQTIKNRETEGYGREEGRKSLWYVYFYTILPYVANTDDQRTA
jgi:hypothetical protein